MTRCYVEHCLSNQIHISNVVRHDIITPGKILACMKGVWKPCSDSGSIPKTWFYKRVPYETTVHCMTFIRTQYFYVFTDVPNMFIDMERVDFVDEASLKSWVHSYMNGQFVMTFPVFTHSMQKGAFTYCDGYNRQCSHVQHMPSPDGPDGLEWLVRHKCFRVGDSKTLAMSMKRWPCDPLLKALESAYESKTLFQMLPDMTFEWASFMLEIDLVVALPVFYAQQCQLDRRLLDFFMSNMSNNPAPIIRYTHRHSYYTTSLAAALPNLGHDDLCRYLSPCNFHYVSKRTHAWDVYGVCLNMLKPSVYKQWLVNPTFRTLFVEAMMSRHVSLTACFNVLLPGAFSLYRDKCGKWSKRIRLFLIDVLDVMDPSRAHIQHWYQTVLRYFKARFETMTPSRKKKAIDTIELMFQMPMLKLARVFAIPDFRRLVGDAMLVLQHPSLAWFQSYMDREIWTHVRTCALIGQRDHVVAHILLNYYRTHEASVFF